MTGIIIGILILIGLLLIALEILVLPGGVVGLIGFSLMVAGVWISYSSLGTIVGNYVLTATIITTTLGLYFLFKGKTWSKLKLSESIRGKVNELNDFKIGDRGVTSSRLAPIGKAYINNQYIEVRTQGDFLDENEEIEVIKVNRNKIIVKKYKK